MADHHDPYDEEEEEEEPKLKYERVGRGVEELVQRDTLSCFVTHEKFIVCIGHSSLTGIYFTLPGASVTVLQIATKAL